MTHVCSFCGSKIRTLIVTIIKTNIINSLQTLLYNFFLQCYYLGIRIAAFFKPKAKLWIDGRRNYFDQLEKAFANNDKPIMWMHCASLGEFEQGRPILEAYKKAQPNHRILLTFFSPSGYEIRKNYAQADEVFYLPLDTKKNAKRFLKIVQPQLAIFVKYEFWYHFLTQLKDQNISTILVSAVFRPKQIFFKWYGGLHRKMLTTFQHVFVQDKASKRLLENSLSYRAVTVAGDSRVDRVMQIASKNKALPIIESFTNNKKTFIAGSTWPPDEDILCEFINNSNSDWTFIIAPHEIGTAHLKSIEQKITKRTLRYSQANQADLSKLNVLIIDNIGMLSTLYRYATIAYVGGGFGKSIHNILEPAAFGIPVIFGPSHQQFTEANILKSEGGGFAIEHKNDFMQCVEFLADKENYKQACAASKQFMFQHQGATDIVLKYLSIIKN